MARVPADERRKDLIRAAIRVIAEHGVDGATTRRIAAEAEASLASLHYVFHSKKDLFFAIDEEQVRLFGELRLDRVPSGIGLGQTAAEILRMVMEWFMDQGDLPRATIELQLWALRHDPSLAVRSYDVYITRTVAGLERARTSEDSDELVESLARMVAAAADGLTLQWLTYRDRDQLAVELELFGLAMEQLVAEHRNPSGQTRPRQPTQARLKASIGSHNAQLVYSLNRGD